MKVTCQVWDCDTIVYAKKVCRFHYDRQRKTGTTDDPVPRPRQSDLPCRARACTNLARTRGYCGGHLERIRVHGDPLEDVPLRRFQDHIAARASGFRECSKCGEVKSLSEFGRDGARLRSDCRSCIAKRQKAKWVPRPRPRRDYDAPYACRRCKLQKPAAEYSLFTQGRPERHTMCRSCASNVARAYREVHRDRLNAHTREWVRLYPEKSLAWKAANRERIRGYARNYHKRHPEVGRRSNWLRKARKLGAPQPKDRRLMAEYASLIRSDPCVYCGSRNVEIDHIVPISKQGSLDWDNLAPACRTCNPSKGTSPVLLFMLRRLASIGSEGA